MKILILTQYYPPEIGAPQNRLHEIAVRLKANNMEVDVLTAMPNYPKMEIFKDYQKGKIKNEIIDGVNVIRAKIYVSKSKSIVSRLLNYFSFVWSSYWRGKSLGNYDYLMVESPPLFLGYGAMRLSKKLKAKMIFNVSDLWPESAEKLNIVSNKLLLKLAYKLEAKCYQKAHLITGQTMGIVQNIQSRFPKKNVHWLPNGVDVDFYNPTLIEKSGFRKKNGFSEDDIIFFYGGILGHAQGLSTLVNAAALCNTNQNIKIIIQGSGPQQMELIELNKKLKNQNVFFREPVSKSEMPGILKEIDVAIIPLKKLEIFLGAIPSKIFESLSMCIPLILGVDGEAKHHFINSANAGLFYEPEDEKDMAIKILQLAENETQRKEMGLNGRKYILDNFNRNDIAKNFLALLR